MSDPLHKTRIQTGARESARALLDDCVARISEIILGKTDTVRLALACLLSRGHLLIEDLPGMGKTTLAHTLAGTLGLSFQRIQFTSDMLPADILGVSVYDQDRKAFVFHPGPIFSQLILADEVNRATPRAQSALLEAMEERQVTVEGETRTLPDPFFVIATQNPQHLVGTFPLPESQLDRFLMSITMGYPDPDAERRLLKGRDRRDLLPELEPVMSVQQLREAQQEVTAIHVSDALLDYLQALLTFSRQTPSFRNGLSPRAGLALLRGAQAWALMAGRDHVLPDDVQQVLPAVVRHRLQPGDPAAAVSESSAEQLLHGVPVP